MDLKELLPPRPDDMHKGQRGRLLIAGGSQHYPGAPALSALGALRSGAGVVTLMSLNSVCSACAARLPEVVYHAEDNIDLWKYFALSQDRMNALVAGPGIERSYEAQKFIADIWRDWPGKILLDGDGLYALAVNRDELRARKNSVITPHEGEAGRLLGITPEEVHADRTFAVKELARKWGCAVLKGHCTLIASGGKFIEVPHGGSELSVPGSGDVLSGCIGAFLAMGLEPYSAAYLGTSIHGMAGELLARGGVDGVLASEIADSLRTVIQSLRCSDES